MGDIERAVSICDLEKLAAQALDPVSLGYYASGAEDELALARNREAFARLRLAAKVLVDVSARDPRTSALGHPIRMPILVGPTAFHRLADEAGELATRRAAAAAGTVMILSTLSNTPVEAVAAAAEGPLWFQLYVYRDREITRRLVERVEAAGCSALFLTVDAPVIGKRERDVVHRFALPEHLTIANMLPEGHGALPSGLRDSGLAAYFASLIDPALTWKDVDWLSSITELPIVIKGITRADDAARARDAGCAGIVVSNHGGRQLDAAPATLDALPVIADEVGGDIEIFVDGGVRRGSDAIKAVALGATAVLVGRPILWGLAAGGEAGAARALEILASELDTAMALCGTPAIESIGADLIFTGSA
jgi:4-hydroxymandelate oxidase